MALTVTQSKTKVLFFSGIFEFPIRISRLISLPFDTWMQRVNGEPVPAPPNATACKNRRHSTDHCRRPRTLISRFPSLSLSESAITIDESHETHRSAKNSENEASKIHRVQLFAFVECIHHQYTIY
nr:hypothetical protein Iba_chr12dCG11050 [Ipomoea batatas]GMD70692.1 hypothetical protein Iba_chr12eCG8770 [Ipomoea batatas]